MLRYFLGGVRWETDGCVQQKSVMFLGMPSAEMARAASS